MEEGIGPLKPQQETTRTSRDVRFVIHDDIDPTSPNPEICNEFKDVSLPIDEGSSPVKPSASRPSFFKCLRLLIEFGTVQRNWCRRQTSSPADYYQLRNSADYLIC